MNIESREITSTIKVALPWIIAIFCICTVINVLQSSETNMRDQINQLTRDEGKLESMVAAQQALEYSTASTLSVLQQNSYQILINTTPDHHK